MIARDALIARYSAVIVEHGSSARIGLGLEIMSLCGTCGESRNEIGMAVIQHAPDQGISVLVSPYL